MNKVRTSQHIRTHRLVKGFRSCVHFTGIQQILPDYGRVLHEECRRLNREQRFEGERLAIVGHPKGA